MSIVNKINNAVKGLGGIFDKDDDEKEKDTNVQEDTNAQKDDSIDTQPDTPQQQPDSEEDDTSWLRQGVNWAGEKGVQGLQYLDAGLNKLREFTYTEETKEELASDEERLSQYQEGKKDYLERNRTGDVEYNINEKEEGLDEEDKSFLSDFGYNEKVLGEDKAKRKAMEKAGETINERSEELEGMRKDIKEMAGKLNSLEQGSVEYVELNDKIRDKATSYQEAAQLLQGVVEEYQNVANKNQLEQFQRGTMAQFFSTKEGNNEFVKNNILPYMQNEDGTTKLDTMEERNRFILQSQIQQTVLEDSNEIVGELIKEGLIQSEDKFYNSPEFNSAIKNIRNATDLIYNENKDELFDGEKIDMDAVYEELQTDERFKNALESYDMMMNKHEQSEAYAKARNHKGILGSIYANEVANINVGTEYLKRYNMGISSERVGSIIHKATNKDTTWKKIIRNVASNPLKSFFNTAGVIVSLRGVTSTASKAASAVQGWKGLGLAKKAPGSLKGMASFADDAIKRGARKGIYAADELAKGLPLDIAIDGAMNDGGALGINLMLGATPALFLGGLKQAPEATDIKKILRLSGEEARKDYMEKVWKGVPQGLDVTDDKAVETFVKGFSENLGEVAGREKSIFLSRVKKGLENEETYSLEFYRRVSEDILDNMPFATEKMAENNISLVGDMKKILNNGSLDEGAKLERLREKMLETIDGYDQAFIQRYLKQKVGRESLNSLSDAMYEMIKKNAPDMPDDIASVAATKAVITAPEDVGKMYTELGRTYPEQMDNFSKMLLGDAKKSMQDMMGASKAMRDTDDPAALIQEVMSKRVADISAEATGEVTAQGLKEGLIKAGFPASKAERLGAGYDEYKKIVDGVYDGGKMKDAIAKSLGNIHKQANFGKDIDRMHAWIGDFHKVMREAGDMGADFPTGVDKSMERLGMLIQKNISNEVKKPIINKMSNLFSKTDFEDTALRGVLGDDFIQKYGDTLKGGDTKNFARKAWKSMVKHDTRKYMNDSSRFVEKYQKAYNAAEGLEKSVIKSYMDEVEPIIKNTESMIDELKKSAVSITKKGGVENIDDVAAVDDFARASKMTGKESQSLPPDIIQRIVTKKEKGVNEFQKTLLRGTENIPSLEETVGGILQGIKKGKNVRIHSEYFTPEGMDLLLSTIGEEKNAMKTIKKSFDLAQDRSKKLGGYLLNNFFDGDAVKFTADVNGKKMSIFDLLSNVDQRLSEGFAGYKAKGGVVFGQNLTLAKVMLEGDDSGKFLKSYAGMLDNFFKELRASNPQKATRYSDFMKQMGYSSNDAVGSAVVDLYGQVKKRFMDLAANQKSLQGISESKVIDMLNPILYNPDEVIYGLMKGGGKNMVDDLLHDILGRLGPQQSKYKGGFNNIRQALDSGKGSFIKYNAGANIRNKQIDALNEFMGDYFRGSDEVFAVQDASIKDYFNKTFGAFLRQSQEGINRKAIVDFKNNLLDQLVDLNPDAFTNKSQDLTKKINELIEGEEGTAEALKKFLGDEGFLKNASKQQRKQIEEYIDGWDVVEEGINKKFIKNSIVENLQRHITETTDPRKPADSFADFMDGLERNAKAREDLIESNSESMRKLFDNESAEMAMKGEEEDIGLLADALGVKKAKAKEVLQEMGYSPNSVNNLLQGQEVTEIPKDQLSKINDALGNGSMTMARAMENPKFADAFEDAVQAAKEATGNDKFYDIAKSGEVVLREDNTLNKFYKLFTSLNMRALYDDETASIQKRFFDRHYEGRIYNPNIPIEGFEGKSVSLMAYKKHFTEATKSFMKEEGLKGGDLQTVLTKYLKNPGKAADVSFDINNAKRQKLYKRIDDYFNDIGSLRKEAAPTDTLLQNVDSTDVDDLLNRLRGNWISYTNDDIVRLRSKYGPGGLEQYTKDMFYGGLFDNYAGRSWANAFSNIYTTLMYNIGTAAPKGFQQFINNTYNANAYADAFMHNSARMKKATQMMDSRMNFSIMRGGKADIVLGGSLKKGKLAFSDLSNKLNALVYSDVATKKNALRASVSQGIYTTFRHQSDDAINGFFDKIDEYADFLQKYEVQDFAFKNRGFGRNAVYNKATKAGDDVDAVMKQYDELYSRYNGDFSKFKSASRSAMGAFYATDNIPELRSLRLIDNHRMVFPLKSWAYGKFGEYSYRIAKELGEQDGLSLIQKIRKSPTIRSMGIEFARVLRMGQNVETVTEGQTTKARFMGLMAIPAVVLSMTLGDAFVKGFVKGKQEFDRREMEAQDNLLADVAASSAVGASEFLNRILGTAFLHQDYLLSQTLESGVTAASMKEDKLGGFMQAMLGNLVYDQVNRHIKEMSKGVRTDTDLDGKYRGDFASWLLNLTLSKGQVKRDMEKSKAFDTTDSAKYGSVGAAGMNLLTGLPGIGTIAPSILGLRKGETPYTGVQLDRFDEYIEENNIDLFNDRYAPQSSPKEFEDLMMNYDALLLMDELSQASESEYQKYLDGDIVASRDEIMKTLLEKGEISGQFLPLGKLQGQLLVGSGKGEDLLNMELESLPDEDIKEVSEAFTDHLLKQGEGELDKSLGTQIEDFIATQTQLGMNMTLGKVVQAMRIGAKNKALNDVFGGDSKKRTQARRLGEEGIDAINFAGDEQFQQYLKERRTLEKGIFTGMRDVIGSNGYIGQRLQNDYFDKDRDFDFPLNSFPEKIKNIQEIRSVAENAVDNGYITDDSLDLLNLSRKGTLDRIDKMDVEQKKKAYTVWSQDTADYADSIENMDISPATKAIAKMSLSYTNLPMVNDIVKTLDIEDDPAQDKLLEEVTRTIDVMTNSSPTDIETGYEVATGKKLEGEGEGGSGKRGKLPSVKLKKPADDLLDSMNKLNAVGAKLNRAGFGNGGSSKGRFAKRIIKGIKKLKYEPLDTMPEIDLGDIEEFEDIGDYQLQAGAARTADLKVATTKQLEGSGASSGRVSAKDYKKSVDFTKAL